MKSKFKIFSPGTLIESKNVIYKINYRIGFMANVTELNTNLTKNINLITASLVNIEKLTRLQKILYL